MNSYLIFAYSYYPHYYLVTTYINPSESLITDIFQEL